MYLYYLGGVGGAVAAAIFCPPVNPSPISFHLTSTSFNSPTHHPLQTKPKVLLTLRAQGYKRVVAIFGRKEEANFVQKRLGQAGALGDLTIEHLSRRSSSSSSSSSSSLEETEEEVGGGRKGKKKGIDIGAHPDLVVFFNPQNTGACVWVGG